MRISSAVRADKDVNFTQLSSIDYQTSLYRRKQLYSKKRSVVYAASFVQVLVVAVGYMICCSGHLSDTCDVIPHSKRQIAYATTCR